MMNIFGFTREMLEEYFLNIGEKKFKATQVFEWLYIHKEYNIDNFSNIKKEVIDPEDEEMLSDLIKSAVNSCVEKVNTAKKENMPNLPSGMGF